MISLSAGTSLRMLRICEMPENALLSLATPGWKG